MFGRGFEVAGIRLGEKQVFAKAQVTAGAESARPP
jgi:hypothetical protein